MNAGPLGSRSLLLQAAATTTLNAATSTSSLSIDNGESAPSKAPSTAKRRTIKRPRSRPKQSLGYKVQWEFMVKRLQEFRKLHGHTIVTKVDDAELYRWTASIRRNYNPPSHMAAAAEEAAPALDVSNFASRWVEGPSSAQNDSANTNTNSSKKRIFRKRDLPREKYRQLEKAEFCWDVQSALWQRRYEELQEFRQQFGHVRVPMAYPNGLGVWAKNQRNDYRRLELGEHSNLTRERLEKLHAVSFKFSKSRKDGWEEKYQELVAFYRQHGHSNVPEHYSENISLGIWCMNQRTAYRKQFPPGGNASAASLPFPSGPLTQDKIQLLQDLKFSFSVRQDQWQQKLNRVKEYYQIHGHVNIPTNNMELRDLRLWLAFQRYTYNMRKRILKRQEQVKDGDGDEEEEAELPMKVPMTEARIAAIEDAIPNFQWKIHDGSGPSREDWEDLFQAMRKKGISPEMRPKQHWFEGEERFKQDSFKDVWTEKDLMELWNQEEDEDDTDFSFDASEMDGDGAVDDGDYVADEQEF